MANNAEQIYTILVSDPQTRRDCAAALRSGQPIKLRDKWFVLEGFETIAYFVNGPGPEGVTFRGREVSPPSPESPDSPGG